METKMYGIEYWKKWRQRRGDVEQVAEAKKRIRKRPRNTKVVSNQKPRNVHPMIAKAKTPEMKMDHCKDYSQLDQRSWTDCVSQEKVRGGPIALASRFGKTEFEHSPGPGEYSIPGSFGCQASSERRSFAGCTFSSAPRTGHIFATGTKSPGPIYIFKFTRSGPEYSFGTGRRISNIVLRGDTPGPGAYIPRLSCQAIAPSFGKPFKRREHFLDNTLTSSGFGFGCNVEDHVKYGRCQDGRCSSRGTWEKKNPTKPRLKYEGNERPPFHIAFLYHDPPFQQAEEMLKQDEELDMDERDEHGRNVLHNICSIHFFPKSCLEKAQAFFTMLEKYAKPFDVNALDKYGNTPIILATKTRQGEMVDLLLKHGAHPEIENQLSETSISIAQEKNYHSIFQLLRAQTISQDKLKDR